MNQQEFKKLRVTGQAVGAVIILLGIVLMVVRENGLYLLGSYAVFWILNYAIIHGHIGPRVVYDEKLTV